MSSVDDGTKVPVSTPTSLPADPSGLAALARAVLLGAVAPLDLVAGWIQALDLTAAGDDLRLLAEYSSLPGLPTGLPSVSRSPLDHVPLGPEPSFGDLADWLPDDDVSPYQAAGARTVAVAPIVVDERPVGAVLVVSRSAWSELAQSLLDAIARQVGLALEQARRDHELRDREHALERRVRELEDAVARSARLDRELVQRNRELSAVGDIARALNQALGLDEVLRRAVERVVDVMQVDASMVRLVDEDELVLVAQKGLSPSYVVGRARLGIDRSASGLAVRRGEPQVIDDCAADPRLSQRSLAGEGVVSAALVPMVVKDRVVGALNAYSRRPRRFSESEVRLLSTIAAEIGIAVENARLYDAERERAAALEELNQLKTDFVLTVSHELRTPMAVVKASLDALWRNWEQVDEPRRRAYLAVGRQGASRLKRLLEELLLVSRIETSAFAPQLEPTDLGALVRSMVEEVQAEHPRRRIELRASGDLPPALADPAALGEILANLLDNAVKYSPADAAIRVEVSAVGDELRLRVVDRGIGIAAEDMSRLFRRFERIDTRVRAHPGTGLGLYICRQLVESMGGRIWAESAPGRGSAFTVALPRSGRDGVRDGVKDGVRDGVKVGFGLLRGRPSGVPLEATTDGEPARAENQARPGIAEAESGEAH